MSDETIVVKSDETMLVAQALQIIHGLALEINTGLKNGKVSFLQHAQKLGWTDKRTKKGALRDVVKLASESFGYEPTTRVTKAMTS